MQQLCARLVRTLFQGPTYCRQVGRPSIRSPNPPFNRRALACLVCASPRARAETPCTPRMPRERVHGVDYGWAARRSHVRVPPAPQVEGPAVERALCGFKSDELASKFSAVVPLLRFTRMFCMEEGARHGVTHGAPCCSQLSLRTAWLPDDDPRGAGFFPCAWGFPHPTALPDGNSHGECVSPAARARAASTVSKSTLGDGGGARASRGGWRAPSSQWSAGGARGARSATDGGAAAGGATEGGATEGGAIVGRSLGRSLMPPINQSIIGCCTNQSIIAGRSLMLLCAAEIDWDDGTEGVESAGGSVGDDDRGSDGAEYEREAGLQAAAAPAGEYLLGDVGQSCTDACAERKLRCADFPSGGNSSEVSNAMAALGAPPPPRAALSPHPRAPLTVRAACPSRDTRLFSPHRL